MQTASLEGGFDNPPTQSALAFRAAMNAMARPGQIEEIQGAVAPAPMSDAAATLLLTLCDHETPLALCGAHDTAEIRDWIAFHIGAPIEAPARAQFALGRWESLPLEVFAIGTPEYPDRSATLIVEMDEIRAEGARLTGPGIQDSAQLSLPAFEAFQQNNALFPLGLDFYFTADAQIVGLPRSTKVEAG